MTLLSDSLKYAVILLSSSYKFFINLGSYFQVHNNWLCIHNIRNLAHGFCFIGIWLSCHVDRALALLSVVLVHSYLLPCVRFSPSCFLQRDNNRILSDYCMPENLCVCFFYHLTCFLLLSLLPLLFQVNTWSHSQHHPSFSYQENHSWVL